MIDPKFLAKELEKKDLRERVEDFLRNSMMDSILKTIASGETSVLVDFKELDKFDYILADQLLEQGEEILKLFNEVINDFELSDKKLTVRFYNLPDSLLIKIKDLRSTHLGRLIVIEGIIRQASEVRPEVVKTKWLCKECGREFSTMQTGFDIKRPQQCPYCQSRRGFMLLDKELSDVQRIIVEESPERLEGAEQPSRMSVILRGDLVDPTFRRKITPGNLVRVIGVLKEIPMKKGLEGLSKRYDLFIEANYVETLHQELYDVEITPKDEKRILELAASDPYRLIVNSIAPSIYGHKEIKEAIALQLFGGVRKRRPDGTWSRGDIHLLLVGDPGAGKSQILKYVANLAPKSRYVSGKGASAVGLTATVVKDEFLKGWTLEAGALVLANGGIVCIDEMDKISKEDIFALHEAMEQQSITIAKANIFATLKAETSILAAANPKFGRFDLNAPIADQISLPETILSRFDLIFPVTDTPDMNRDAELAEYILKMHKVPEKGKPPIDTDLLRKYIAYAKQKVKPKLSDAAIQIIKQFFVDIRQKNSEKGSIAITPRQLEALVRLSEASAKLRLSPIVEKVDALRAVKLMKFTLYRLAYDAETGTIDIDRMQGGIPAKKRSKISRVFNIIKELENTYGKSIPRDAIKDAAAEEGIDRDEVDRILDELRMKGLIIEPRNGIIERID